MNGVRHPYCLEHSEVPSQRSRFHRYQFLRRHRREHRSLRPRRHRRLHCFFYTEWIFVSACVAEQACSEGPFTVEAERVVRKGDGWGGDLVLDG